MNAQNMLNGRFAMLGIIAALGSLCHHRPNHSWNLVDGELIGITGSIADLLSNITSLSGDV